LQIEVNQIQKVVNFKTHKMKNLEKEIIAFHCKQADIANEESTLSKMEEEIIKKYCPFKKGDNVIFTEWWRGNGKDYFGIIKSIKFNGIDENAIDSRWIICVEPTTKDFSKPKGSFNSAYKYLGENKKDIIRKA
jgi:hypothetical protein